MASLIPWRRKSSSLASEPSPRGPNEFFGMMNQMREEMNQWFDQFFNFSPMAFSTSNFMKSWGIHFDENPEAFTLEAEAPGFEPQDFSIELAGQQLNLKATKKFDAKGKKGTEGEGYQEWSQSITLPAEVIADKVEASYHNGILKLMLPKAQVAKGKKITVKSS